MAVSELSVETLGRKIYNKLQQKLVGPYRVVNVQKNTVTIEEDGQTNAVSIDRGTHAPSIPVFPNGRQLCRSHNVTYPKLDFSEWLATFNKTKKIHALRDSWSYPQKRRTLIHRTIVRLKIQRQHGKAGTPYTTTIYHSLFET